MTPRRRQPDLPTSWKRALAQALLAEGTRLVIIAVLAASSIAVLHATMSPDEHRWGGRTVEEWLPSLASPIAVLRDSALAAQRALEPRAGRTLRSAATLLSDPDERVSTSAMHSLVDAADAGGVALAMVYHVVRRVLNDGDSRARAHAARVAGALGKVGGPLAEPLLTAGADTAAFARAAVASALGSMLETTPLHSEGLVRRRAIARLLSATHDPAWLVREAALEALFRAAPTDARLGVVVDSAMDDHSDVVRERAASIKIALKGRGYTTRNQQ